MSDERLRELERRARRTGSAWDRAALLRERLRRELIAPERIHLAAYLGDPTSLDVQPACEHKPHYFAVYQNSDRPCWCQAAISESMTTWTRGVAIFGCEVGVRAGMEAVEVSIEACPVPHVAEQSTSTSLPVGYHVYRVVDFTRGNASTAVLTVDGVTTTLVEGVDFVACVSNGVTAVNLACAISTIDGVFAIAIGETVYVSPGIGGSIRIELMSGDDLAWTVGRCGGRCPNRCVMQATVLASLQAWLLVSATPPLQHRTTQTNAGLLGMAIAEGYPYTQRYCATAILNAAQAPGPQWHREEWQEANRARQERVRTAIREALIPWALA